MLSPHIVIVVHDRIEDTLCLGLAVDKIVHVGLRMSRLVAVTIVADKTSEIFYFISPPRLIEKRIEFLFYRFFRGIKRNNAMGIVRSVEEALPSIGLAKLVGEVRVIGVELTHETSVGSAPAIKSGGGVEDVAIVLRALHQQVVVGGVAQFASHKSGGIIIVGILDGFGYGCFVFVEIGYVVDSFFGYPTLLEIFIEIGSALVARYSGVFEQ